MQFNVLSLENLAIIQVAVLLIKSPTINNEIYCLPTSEFWARKDDIDETENFFTHRYKELWYEVVERKTKILIEKLYSMKYLTKQLQTQVVGAVLLLGYKMLSWTVYHMGILKFSHSSININFLSSCFSCEGIIDNKMAAIHLMRNKNLNFKQKYKLACIYCFAEDIPTLYQLMTEGDKEECHNLSSTEKIIQPPVIEFWANYCSGEIESLTDSENLYEYMLDKSIESGSLTAVDYALKRVNCSRYRNILVKAAMKAVEVCYSFKDNDAGFIFEDIAVNSLRELWVPIDYYVQIISFLLLKMTKFEQIQLMHKDLQCLNARFKRTSIVLEFFLDLPYQNYFLKAIKTMWEYLPEEGFAELLIIICWKITCTMEKCKNYAEGLCYNYKKLFGEFWCQSPESYKKCIFADNKPCHGYGNYILRLFLSQENLTREDIENIHQISLFAPDELRENLCKYLVMHNKWILLNEFMHCIWSGDRIKSFKKSMCAVSGDGVLRYVRYITNNDWNGLKLFLRWSCLSEEEINILKKIVAPVLIDKLNEIPREKIIEVFDSFCTWCFSSNEEVEKYKRLAVYSCKFIHFFESNQYDLAGKFIDFCLFTEKEVKKLKRYIADKYGGYYCEAILTDYKTWPIILDQNSAVIARSKLKRNKWEEVMKCLTWCFSSEEEINIFKKKYFEERSKSIHAALVIYGQYNEAETFFTWLELSPSEIKHLKLSTFFVREKFYELLYAMLYKVSEICLNYGNKQEALELIFRWCFTDRETILEFQNDIKMYSDSINFSPALSEWQIESNEELRAACGDFMLVIGQQLKDMQNEQKDLNINKF